MKERGFTLLETLLFIAVSSVILLIVAGFLALLLTAQTKQRLTAEVDESGIRALRLIGQGVQESSALQTPSIGSSETTLVLTRRDANLSPTTLDISSSTLRLTEGAALPVSLHSSSLRASSLSIANRSPSTSTPGIVTVQFTLATVNPSSRPEYAYVRTFESTFSLR